jgi:hypothetical protein
MPSPRLFGRDFSKKQGDERGPGETEDNPDGRKHEPKQTRPKANTAVMLDILGDLWGRGKPVEPKSGA